jgi:TRAP-type C4-dicarboxylate transport system permease small subunit
MRRTLDTFYGGLTALAALALLAAFACVMLGIVDRQVNWGLRGLDAYAGYCIASALFLALPGTLQAGEHIRVTLLLQRLPAAWRSAFEWWSLGLGLLLSGLLAGYACRLVWVSQVTHDISQGSDATPLWLPQIAMALGCIGLFVALADSALSRATGSVFEHASTGEAARVE